MLYDTDVAAWLWGWDDKPRRAFGTAFTARIRSSLPALVRMEAARIVAPMK
ncbi:MAG: hypothetical protein QM682_10700 [Paracoccus sp. (in: a-proteobacteria)]|uniref:hypothetical protein n=1 Tax=Paracoccus sp. TaxID=267 RepID=UPI0039E2E426